MTERPTYEELEKRIHELEEMESDFKKSKQALQESKDRFQLLYERAPLAYQSLDKKGNFIEVNKAWLEVLGYSREEVIGKSFGDFLHPDWREHFKKNFPRFKTVGEILGIEFEMVKKDGSFILVSFHGKIGKNTTGNFQQTHCIFQDITERKKYELALMESEHKLATHLKETPIGALAWDLDFKAIEWNPAAEDIFGYSKAESIGKHATELLLPEDMKEVVDGIFRDIISEKGGARSINENITKDGRRIICDWYNTVLKDTDDKVIGIASLVQDITERKQIEAQLRQSRKMESIGTLAGGISHDFNNLLHVISGNTELALEEIPKWNPVHSNLEEIKSASLRAAGIVRQLLDFSRRDDLKLEPIGAVTVIKDALKFLRSTIPTTIDIRKHLPDVDITIRADPTQINQVMMNLCINASQAMEDTGGIIEIKVDTVSLTGDSAERYLDLPADDYLKITVSDTGPGIAPEIIEQLFDPYFTTKETGKGSGLGLSIVHGIVKNHGGAVLVESKLGKGTTFVLLFPLIAEKPEIETETIDEIPRGHETILFVDDEESILDMTQKTLELLGYGVETSMNPLEALDLFLSKPDTFDLVITDMTMPQMTGVTLFEKLREIRPDIPVIICTGHSSLVNAERAKQLGVDGYVMKPVSRRMIAKSIRKVLDKKDDE